MLKSISLSLWVSLAFCSVLISCSATGSPSLAGAKASVISRYGGVIGVSVYLEGSDGDCVTGAKICAANPAGEVQVLGFDQARGCYYDCFDTQLSGEYRVRIDSVLLGSTPKIFSIEHDPPSGAPTAIQCTDSGGNNALVGQSLRRDEAISLKWAEVPGATLYSVQLSDGTELAYEGTAETNNLVIPAGAMPSGSYDVRIEAQWLEGDPYLITTDTYSASASEPYSFALDLE
jgi:hypothetical protein